MKKARACEGSSVKAKTEFGGGLAVCLVKFARHFENDMAQRIRTAHAYATQIINTGGTATLEELKNIDITRLNHIRLFVACEMKVQIEMEPALAREEQYKRALSHLITLWANGATDHLYEMKVPPGMEKTKLGKAIVKLKSAGLDMGHGFKSTVTYTFDDFIDLINQTVKIAAMIDKALKLKPDFGGWD